MPTLSLAMIVKDEAGNLAHCLDSVRDLVDELVVVDTGSTDGTVALAEGYGARMGHFPWTGDFSAARNESLRLCTGDWVLVLDADEAVDPLDHPVIRGALARPTADAYRLVSRNYADTADQALFDQAVVPNESPYREGRQHPFYADTLVLRLFRRLPGLQYEGRIHELVTPFFAQNRRPVGTLPAVIHHFGKLDGGREAAKRAAYLELARRDAEAQPLREQAQFNLLVQAHAAGDWDTAIQAGRACLRLNARPPLLVHATFGSALLEAGRAGEALPLFERILALEPGHVLALDRLARCHRALGRPAEARGLLRRAIETQPRFAPPYVVLAELEEAEGGPAAARAILLQGLQALPLHEPLHLALVQLDLRHHQEAQAAADAWAALRALPTGGGGHWHALVASFLLREGHPDQGRAVLRLGLEAFPEHELLRSLGDLAG